MLLSVSAGMANAGCLPITGSRIQGRDLADADARFSKLPATLVVGFTALPGAQQIFTPADLQKIARANGIPAANFGAMCFELPMRRFSEGEATASMRAALPPEAELTIVELEGASVPAGPVEFPVEGLEPATPSSRGVRLWRGFVKYAETRRAPVWARVKVTLKVTAVVTDKDVAQGATIHASSLRIETRTTPFEHLNPATRIEDVSGRIAKRALQAGSIVPLNVLADAPTVHKGDSVPVIVESGLARLRFEAVAESAARDGETIELRNPANGKTFKARLDSGPKALIVIRGEQL